MPSVDAMSIFNAAVNRLFVAIRHSTIGVWHYQNPVDSQQIRRQDQGSQHVVGDSRTSVAQNLGIARLHADNRERINPRVNTSNDRQTFSRGARQVFVFKSCRKLRICLQYISKSINRKFSHSEMLLVNQCGQLDFDGAQKSTHTRHDLRSDV